MTQQKTSPLCDACHKPGAEAVLRRVGQVKGLSFHFGCGRRRVKAAAKAGQKLELVHRSVAKRDEREKDFWQRLKKAEKNGCKTVNLVDLQAQAAIS